MVKKTDIERDFSFLKDRVMGVLIYGSQVKGEKDKRSDIDICVVAGKKKPLDVLQEIWRQVNTKGKNYDVKIFEELPLYLKGEVMENNEVVYAKDKGKLFEYFMILENYGGSRREGRGFQRESSCRYWELFKK